MLSGTKFLNNLARYDSHLNRRFYRAVELMMKTRREERKSREAQAAADDSTAYRDPSHRDRGVNGSPRFTSPTAYPEAPESPEDRPRPVIGFQWGRSPGLPSNEPESARGPKTKPQNEAEPDLTPAGTTSYQETRAIRRPPRLA